MSILQWNIQSIKSNFCELKVLLREEAPSCVCLQETMLGDFKMNPPSQYKIIQSQRKRDDGHERGTAILVRNNTNFEELPLTTNLQAVAAKVWFGKWYTVCSIYLPHIPIQQSDIESLIVQLPRPFLLLGDMNARHHLWGENIINEKGQIFENLITSSNISLMNSQAKTHYHIQTGTYTTIDLSICSSDCLLDFDHTVLGSLHGSDHYPIRIKANSDEGPVTYSGRLKTEKADWKTFTCLTEHYQPPNQSLELDVKHLNDFIIETAEKCMPTSVGNPNKIPVPWWSQECEDAKRERRRNERALKRTESIGNKIAYKRSKARCRKTFKTAQKESWKKYATGININTPSQVIWKRIRKMDRKFKPSPPPLLRNSDGTLSQDPEITANLFAHAFASVSSVENYPSEFRNLKERLERAGVNFETQTPLVYNEPFSMNEFHAALSETTETSPGFDRITYSMIKNSHKNLQECILRLFNRIYSENVFPTDWKLAIIIPIPKPNKDHSIPLNYRPISLTSCLCKLLEKMVNKRLVWILEEGNHINDAQSGFRRNRSTTDCLVQFECDIRNAISRRDHTIAVYFDLAKAYDMTWRHGILRKLQEMGLRGNMPKFIMNFLTNRYIKVRVGNTLSEQVMTEEGTPQGSVLSCTLFMIAINDVSSAIPPTVRHTLYVDDLTIYASGKSNSTIERQLQMCINNLEKWCKQTGFSFSPSKTFAQHICRKRRCPKACHQLSINNQPILTKEEHSFLGLLIDSSLTWKPHIELLKRKCIQKLDILKHLSYKTWGSDSKILLRLFVMIIKPKLDYGVEAYSSASKSNIDKLEPIQNNAMRIATGAFKSSPIISLQIICGLKPLEYNRELKLITYLMRVIANPSNPIMKRIEDSGAFHEESDGEEDQVDLPKGSILERGKNIIQKYNVSLDAIETEGPPRFPPWKTGNVSVCEEVSVHHKSENSEAFMRNIFLNHLSEHEVDLKVYTDGSKTNEGVGFSIHCEETSASHRLREHFSIFTAELYGLLEAVKYAKTRSSEQLALITDSRSSIQAIIKPFSRNVLVQKIQAEISDFSRPVKLCWTPSHCNIRGNEMADQLARRAISNYEFYPATISRDDLRNKLKRDINEKWREKWRNAPENKLREITDSTTELPNFSCSNREWERTLTRLRIGHTKKTHGFMMAQAERPYCEDCTVPLSVRHILLECPSFSLERTRFFPDPNVTLRKLLVDESNYNGNLYKFLKDINIFNEI